MQIHLAHFDRTTSACLRIFEAQLSPSELMRYRRFLRKDRAQQFLIGRGLLRRMLATHLDLPPEQIPLLEQANQAPRLMLAHSQTLSFSISHSREWVACCVCADGKIGLDIEVIDTGREILELAERCFDASLVQELQALSAEARVDHFYQCWTAHEAKVKLGEACLELRHVKHPNLAIALCSDQALVSMPELIVVDLE